MKRNKAWKYVCIWVLVCVYAWNKGIFYIIKLIFQIQPRKFRLFTKWHSDQIRLDQISRLVVSDFLWPHELQHARPPCPSPTPGVHWDSRPIAIKKAEHQRTDAFELWCWRGLLRVPCTARSNQSILNEINPKYSLERLMLKLQYFGHLMRRADSLEKTVMVGKMEGRRKRGWWRMRRLAGITDSGTWVWASSGRWWRTEQHRVLQSMRSQRVEHDWVTEQQN